MGFVSRLSFGWTIIKNSFKVLKENKQLILFPVLSGISLLLIILSFAMAIYSKTGSNFDVVGVFGLGGTYALVFAYYIINCFVVVFFNMALVHCASLYFKGEEVTISKGIQFSVSRIGVIIAWAMFAGTVGAVLRIIQENLGRIGKIVIALIGISWGIATFFVVPVIANENLGPIDAFKRSTQLIKEKWGSSLGEAFSFGLIQLGFLLLAAIPAYLVWIAVSPFAGAVIGALAVAFVLSVYSAVRTIFITAVYHNVTGDPVELYNQQFVDNLFATK